MANLVDVTPRRVGPERTVGPLGFGTWRFTHDAGRATAVLEAAVEAGLTLVDTADVYGGDWGGSGVGTVEEAVGRVLAERPDLREAITLVTKGGIRPGVPYDSSPAHVRRAVDEYRRRLGVDVIDCWLVHRPDALTHPAHLADALVALIADGAVASVGLSNHGASHSALLADLLAERGAPLAALQPELSIVHRAPIDDGTLDLAHRTGAAVLAWSPLAGGALATGDGVRPELVAVLDELAAREGIDRSAVAIAFVLALPSRPVALIGSQDPDRIAATASAVARTHLDRADWYRLVEAAQGEPLP